MASTSYFGNEDLYSECDAESDIEKTKRKRRDLDSKPNAPTTSKATKEFFAEEWNKEDRKQRLMAFDTYTRHKILVNEYMLYYPGATEKILKRDTSRDKKDIDVIRENLKFLWDDTEEPTTWEKKLAKRYYDKLFKEYCIADLSRYKENKVAMRWRTEKEVIDGKGQFICGEKRCNEKRELTSWEVNFAYMEDGAKKNALVKLRLCIDCSHKLNYHHKKRVAARPKRLKHQKVAIETDITSTSEEKVALPTAEEVAAAKAVEEAEMKLVEKEVWSKPMEIEEEKSREEEFTDFLEDLFM